MWCATCWYYALLFQVLDSLFDQKIFPLNSENEPNTDNVGILQSALDTKTSERPEKRCRTLANDIAEGLGKHRLELLCLCELGEHEIGLQSRKNLRCESQDDLLRLIVRVANEDLQGGAPEPAVEVELASDQHPTYAAMKRRGPKLSVEAVFFHGGLDRKPGKRPDRTMMTLHCRWKDPSR